MNCTTFGGSTRFRGCIPILANSSWNGLHHRIRVFTDTPARRANSDFNIAFIPSINFLIVLLALDHPPLREPTEKVHNVKWVNNWTLLTGLLRNVKLLYIINVKYLCILLIFSTLAEKFSYAKRLSANPFKRICTHL